MEKKARAKGARTNAEADYDQAVSLLTVAIKNSSRSEAEEALRRVVRGIAGNVFTVSGRLARLMGQAARLGLILPSEISYFASLPVREKLAEDFLIRGTGELIEYLCGFSEQVPQKTLVNALARRYAKIRIPSAQIAPWLGPSEKSEKQRRELFFYVAREIRLAFEGEAAAKAKILETLYERVYSELEEEARLSLKRLDLRSLLLEEARRVDAPTIDAMLSGSLGQAFAQAFSPGGPIVQGEIARLFGEVREVARSVCEKAEAATSDGLMPKTLEEFLETKTGSAACERAERLGHLIILRGLLVHGEISRGLYVLSSRTDPVGDISREVDISTVRQVDPNYVGVCACGCRIGVIDAEASTGPKGRDGYFSAAGRIYVNRHGTNELFESIIVDMMNRSDVTIDIKAFDLMALGFSPVETEQVGGLGASDDRSVVLRRLMKRHSLGEFILVSEAGQEGAAVWGRKLGV